MITLTAEATTQLRRLLAEKNRPGLFLRLFVQPGGCRGFSYGMAFDDDMRDDDVVVEHEGVRIAVDPFSARLLEGARVDYTDALMGGGFTITNPNAVSTCGCGRSFRTRGARGNPQSCCH